MKAKWVRIELRKVETLPGGSVANTFFDFVGQSPINLWQSANDEYSTLHTVSVPRVSLVRTIPPDLPRPRTTSPSISASQSPSPRQSLSRKEVSIPIGHRFLLLCRVLSICHPPLPSS